MSTQEQLKPREIWLDNLRIIAIICVVIIHVSRLPDDHFDYFAQIYQSSVRFCVPLFVMISGAIQLNRSTSAFSFLKKRIPKMLFILWFWGSAYILFNHFFASPYNIKGYFGSFLLSSTPGSFHLWFLYLIIELYLITPLLWLILCRLSSKQLIVLLILLVLLFFDLTPLIIMSFSKTRIITISSFPNYLLLFVPYIPYYLAGKVIKDISPQFTAKQVVILICVFCLSLIYSTSMSINFHNDAFYSYTSINMFFCTTSLFCLFYCLGNVPIFGHKLNVKLANASFGIYLIHNLVRNTFSLFKINSYSFIGTPAIGVPIYAILVILISYALTMLLKSNRFTKTLV
jgi:surface polysaccharide O-acyltransferase-like enzyme